MVRQLHLDGFDPDSSPAPAMAFKVKVAESMQEIPFHSHRKGQLILALHGGITTEVEQAMWMVPPHYAVWIPSHMVHSNRATAKAKLCFLFIEPGYVAMPQQCCTLKISPLLRELILHLASQKPSDTPYSPEIARVIQVIFDQMPDQPMASLQLPISANPKLRTMVEHLAQAPHENYTLAQWAKTLALSERTLARLIVKETGLNFRRWRQQLQLIISLQRLLEGDSVTQVAETLGYDSTTAFISMFKKSLGNTPARYLKAQQAGEFL